MSLGEASGERHAVPPAVASGCCGSFRLQSSPWALLKRGTQGTPGTPPPLGAAPGLCGGPRWERCTCDGPSSHRAMPRWAAARFRAVGKGRKLRTPSSSRSHCSREGRLCWNPCSPSQSCQRGILGEAQRRTHVTRRPKMFNRAAS